MSVKRAQREVDSQEFAEWMAYSLVEPFGPRREDERAGAVAATVANVNRDPSKRAQPFEPDDFLSRYSPEAEAKEADSGPSEDGLKSKLMAWAAAMAEGNKGKRPKSELREKRGGRGG